MDRNWIFILIIVVGAVIFYVSCNSTNENNSGAGLTNPENLKNFIETSGSDYILVDVRTKAEFDSGHIPTAILIPYDTITRNLPTTDKDAVIIVYCRSGRRSGIAKNALEQLGYTKVTDFGGITNWKWDLE